MEDYEPVIKCYKEGIGESIFCLYCAVEKNGSTNIAESGALKHYNMPDTHLRRTEGEMLKLQETELEILGPQEQEQKCWDNRMQSRRC